MNTLYQTPFLKSRIYVGVVLAMSNENQKVPQTGKEFKGSRVPVKRQMGFYWTLEPWTPGTLF
jgi:hypothetical protein